MTLLLKVKLQIHQIKKIDYKNSFNVCSHNFWIKTLNTVFSDESY